MVLKRTTNSRLLLKILSVFISLLLWVYVSNSEHISIDKNIELEILYPSNVSLINETPKEIVYSLKGPRAIVRLILDREEKLTIDLRNQKVDSHHRHFFNFKPTDIDLPIGVQVLKILPQNIELTFDEKIKKSLPVALQTVGAIHQNFKMFSTKISPTHLDVYGPKKELNNLKEISAGPVDLSVLKGVGRKSLPVVGLSERVSLASETLPEFNFDVRPIKSNISFKKIPIKFDGKFKVRKSTSFDADVFLYDEDGDNLKVNKGQIIIEAIMPNSAGDHTIHLKTNLPEKVYLFKIVPDFIKVNLE